MNAIAPLRSAGVRVRRAAPLLSIVAALAAVTLGLAHCSHQSGGGDEGGGSSCTCETTPVVDPALLAFLSKARAAHHEADLAESGGDRERAVYVLERLVSGPRPPTASGATAPEVSEVLADTHARLADLRSASGDFERAGADVEQGLNLATTPTHFRGHLVEMRGVVEERRSIALKEQGDDAGAERARRAAIAAFEQAIEIQDEVIQRALGDAGLPAGGDNP